MSEEPLRVLLVDDDADLREPLAKYLQQSCGYQVDTAAYSNSALAMATSQTPYDVALIDYFLISAADQEPEPSGIQLLTAIKAHCPLTECILFTGWDTDVGLEALRAGAFRYMRKPFEHLELGPMIEHAVEHRRLKGAAREKEILAQLMATSAVLLGERSLQEILKVILRGVQALGFDRVRLYLLSADGQFLEGHAHLGMDPAFTQLKIRVQSDRYFQKLLNHPRPQVFARKVGKPVPYEQALAKEDVNQWACVPLLFQGKVIGKLSVDNKFTQRSLVEAELDSLALFAIQAAAAIENARLMTAAQAATRQATQYARHLAAIQEVSRVITSLVEPEAVLQAACKAVVELFAVDHSGLVHFAENYEQGYVVAEYPDSGATGLKILVRGVPAEERLINAQEPIVLTDVAQAEALGDVREVLLGLGIHSILVVPVVSKGRVLASFSLDVTRQPRTFTPEEVELCKIFAAQVAAALENAELFAAAQRQATQLEKLRHSSLAMTSQLDRDKLLKVIIEQAVAFLNAKGGCIYEYDAEQAKLRAVADYGLPADLQGHTLGMGEGIAGQLVQTKQPYMSVEDYEQWPGRAAVYAGKVSFGSVIDVLLQWQERIVGVLCINDTVGRKFTESDARLLQLFADQAAIALHNAKLVAQIAAQKEHQVRLIASAPAGVVAIDRKGQVTSYNAQAQEILKYQPDEVLGQSVAALYADREALRVGKLLEQAPDGRLADLFTFVRSKSGERIPIRLSATWLYDAQGQPSGSVGYFEDLRTLLEAEKRLHLLVEASNIVAQAETLKDGLQRLTELLVTFLGVSFGGIELLDDSGQFLVVEAAFPVLSSPLAWNPRIDERTLVRHWPGLSEFLDQSEPFTLDMTNESDQAQLLDITHQYQLAQVIQSMLFIPLRTRQRTVGLLFLGELREPAQVPFSAPKVELVKAVAEQTAVLIERMRLQETAQNAHQRLHLSYQASNTLVSSTNPKQMLYAIVEQARVTTRAAWVSVLLIDELGYVQTLITNGIDKQFDVSKVIRPAGISMQVMQTGETFVIEDANQQRARVNPSMFRAKVGAALCLPLSLRGKRIGVMWVHWKAPRYFSTSELEAIQLYVNQAAIAYDSSRRIAELEHMRRAVEALAGAAGPREVLAEIVASAHEVLQADSAVLWPYDTTRDQFVLDEALAVGVREEIWEEFRKSGPRPGGTAYTVMEQGWISVSDTTDRHQSEVLGTLTRALLKRIHAKSFQGMVLTADGQKLGVLYLNYKRPRSFSDDERQIAQTFANHAALALKKAKLLEQVNKTRNAAYTVAEVTVLENLQTTLNAIVQRTYEALRCDAATLYTYDWEREKFGFPPALVGVKKPEKVLALGRVLEHSALHNILVLNDLYVAENTQHDPLLHGRFAKEEEIVASVGIPLLAGEHKVGVMFVNYRRAHRFTDEELANVRLFAYQAAVAIRNAQLYDGVQKRAAILEALYNAGRLVPGSLDLNEILKRIAEQATHLARDESKAAGFTDITLLEGTKANFVAVYPPEAKRAETLGSGVDLALGVGQDRRIGIVGRAIKLGKPQRVDDVTKDCDYLLFHAETRSELAVPIKVGGRVIGAINVEHRDYDAFDLEHQYALEALAAQAGIAIYNAQLYAGVQRQATVLDAIYGAGRAVTGALDLNEILNRIAEQAAHLIDHKVEQVGFANIMLATGAKASYVASYPRQALAKIYETLGKEVDLNKGIGSEGRIGIIGRAIKTGKPQLVSDVTQNPDYLAAYQEIRSELAVPIKLGDEVIGAINIEHPKQQAFAQEHLLALEHLAMQATLAVRMAQLYDQERRQVVALEALHRAGRAVTSSLDLDEILSSITEQASVLTSAAFSNIELLIGDQLVFEAAYPPEQLAKLRACVSTVNLAHDERIGIIGRATRLGQSLRIGDVAQDPDYINYEPSTHSQLSVPIKVGAQVIGVISVEDPNYDAFDAEDQRDLEVLAAWAASAIQNARQYETLRRQSQHRTAVYVASKVISTELAIEQKNLLYRILEQTVERIKPTKGEGCCLGTIQLYNKFTNELHIEGVYPPQAMQNTENEVGKRRPLDRSLGRIGISGRTILEQKSQRVADVQSDADYLEFYPPTRAQLSVPLIEGDEILGVLSLESDQVDAFDEENEQALHALAELSIIAIQYARQYQTLQNTKSQVAARTALAWMGMASSVWRHTIANHATTIEDLVLLSRRSMKQANLSLDQLTTYLSEITEMARKIREAPITAPLSVEEGTESVAINELLRERVKQLQQSEPFASVQVAFDLQAKLTATVRASPEWLRRAFDLLISNAVEAMQGSNSRQIFIKTHMADEGIKILIADTGPGIPEEVKPKLFRSQIKKQKGGRGLGIGLLMAQTIVQAYRGDIGIESTDSTGTTMWIWLPLEPEESAGRL